MKFTRIIPAEEKVAGFRELETLDEPWISGYMETMGRKIPVLKTKLSVSDQLGALAVRCNLGRNRYSVLPGLYATGKPDQSSPVLITANYKLSLDSLRKELSSTAAWILVLDTKGVNVWCAAGKGSFGTSELAGKIRATKIVELVEHRRLVLPQLGAVGVSAPELAKLTGFRVIWGPVRAADLPAFMDRGMKKDESMRRVDFGLVDRLKLVPMELV
ncbi:MAG: mercury methylation corrinoid protein HgcA, partial [Spirochaetota bacterium]